MRGHLNHAHTDRPHFNKLARACTWISFGLLILTALSLLTSPLTQQVWTWDRFLHGGQDFESSLLILLVSFCLLLLLAQHFKQAVDLTLGAWSRMARASNRPAVEGPAVMSHGAADSSPPPVRNYRRPLTI
jgi:hypothetical protein